MSLSRDTREEKKMKAALRAQFSLRQRFERIDWEEDILIPLTNDLKSGKAHFELEPGEVIGLTVEDENADSSH